jgi:penicillin V acylase-like amidase (Ntn superfamily)
MVVLRYFISLLNGLNVIMSKKSVSTPLTKTLLAACLTFALGTQSATACTRAMYVGPNNVVVTGRNMDWSENMDANLWSIPRGTAHDGAAGKNSIKWVSKYGSVVATAYDIAAADGMNEKGLVANTLYLANAEWGDVGTKPTLSVSLWAQYALDNFATVTEAVTALRAEPFRIGAPNLPNGSPSSVHLSLSDPTGDSAIFEYLEGVLVIHHGKQFKVMTNEPSYDTQLAINSYWTDVGGLNFLPGSFSPSDRFARASFMVGALPTELSKAYAPALPDQSLETQASLGVLGVMRAVSVPLGEGVPGKPNISTTLWRSVSDQKNKVYYFDSATSPSAFWVDLKQVDFKEGAAVKKLTMTGGKTYSGNATALFATATLFKPLSVVLK